LSFFALQWLTIKEMLNWRVSLDILLIATIIYFIYFTLRTLRTWKVVSGLIVAFVLFLAARIIGLQGINYIFSNFSHVALLAMIIVFQPEIRRIFERAASLRRNEAMGKGSPLSTQLRDTIFTLAQQKCGALFVFPGRDSIQPWTSEGIALEARPSPALILSLFDHNSPGHDGAMVIRNGRVASFGVRLPVSKTAVLPEGYGTRHNAALGLAEVTDALVIVVSEERGSISTFRNGKMEIVIHKAQIDTAIKAHWEESSSYPIQMQRAGRQRWGLFSQVAVSLLLAFLFWSTVVVTQTQVLERGFTVPVEYTATGEKVALVGNKPTEVKLHMAGPRSALDNLDLAQLAVKIDLSKAGPGRQTVVVTEENIRLPRGLRLLDVIPPAIDLTLKALEEREVGIKPQLVGQLPEGLRLAGVVIAPKMIRVLAPQGELNRKESGLKTTPIYLEDIRETTQLLLKVVAPPGIQPVDRKWPDVLVEVEVISQEKRTPANKKR